METTKTKNFKELESFIKHCEEKKDSLMCFFCPNEKVGGEDAVVLGGNAHSLIRILVPVLRNAFTADDCEEECTIANIFLNSVYEILCKKDEAAMRLTQSIIDIFEEAQKDDEEEIEVDVRYALYAKQPKAKKDNKNKRQ